MQLRSLGLAASIWIGLAILAAASFGFWPSTWTGALAFVLVAPLLYLAVEAIGEVVFGPLFKYKWLNRAPSWLRVIYGVVAIAAPFVGVALLLHWFKVRP